MDDGLAVVWASAGVIGRGIVASLMTTAGVLKFCDEGFAATISEIGQLPRRAGKALARVIPPLEIAAGLGLLISPISPLASAVCAVLIGTYAVAMVSSLARGRRAIRCGCFGPRTADMITWRTVGRNGILLIAITPALLPDAFFRAGDQPDLSAGAGTVLLLGSAGSTLAVLILRYLLGLPEWARRNEIARPEKEMP